MLKHLAAALMACACATAPLAGQSASVPVTVVLRPDLEIDADTVTVMVPFGGERTGSTPAWRGAERRSAPPPDEQAMEVHFGGDSGLLSLLNILAPLYPPTRSERPEPRLVLVYLVTPNH